MQDAILKINHLTVAVQEFNKETLLVNDLNLEIPRNRITALVGSSGSGKTTTGLAILRLLPQALYMKKGAIVWEGQDLMNLSENQMRLMRGKKIGMVFQEPLNAFNPVFTIGFQIGEVLKQHTTLSGPKINDEIVRLLTTVGVDDPPRILNSYPYQLSGGLRQRAMIAQAIAASPSLIIADEPTSNLDVTLQAHIMELFRKLRDELKMTILLISHDLGMVVHLAEQVAILANGRMVESGETKSIWQHPRHPFTQQLKQKMVI